MGGLSRKSLPLSNVSDGAALGLGFRGTNEEAVATDCRLAETAGLGAVGSTNWEVPAFDDCEMCQLISGLNWQWHTSSSGGSSSSRWLPSCCCCWFSALSALTGSASLDCSLLRRPTRNSSNEEERDEERRRTCCWCWGDESGECADVFFLRWQNG